MSDPRCTPICPLCTGVCTSIWIVSYRQGQQLPTYLLFQWTLQGAPHHSKSIHAHTNTAQGHTYKLACSAVGELNTPVMSRATQPKLSTLDVKMTPLLSGFTACTATSTLPPPSRRLRWRPLLIWCYVQSCGNQNPHRSDLGEIQSDETREHCKRKDLLSVTVCDSGSASQGMKLSPCPFLTLKSPKGPRGCGKWEARSLLNSCVIEFPHNTANVCMGARTSVPRAQWVKQGAKIPRTNFVLKQ